MTGRTLIFTVAGPAILTLSIGAQVGERPELQLQAAIKQELVDGDLKGAIERYKALVKNGNPAVAARALVHLAASYDKLGQPEARATYERVVREYPNQKDAATDARAWLAVNGATSNQRTGRAAEVVWTGPGVTLGGRVSPDGRYLPFSGIGADLSLKDLKTGEVRRLTYDATNTSFPWLPVPSPDGKQIAYRFGSEIRLIGSEGANVRVLLRDRQSYGPEAWSPDGKYLAAVRRNPDDTAAIGLISTTDGTVTQLKSTGPNAQIGGFSPDGRFLVYAEDSQLQGSDGGVFALAADGSREAALVQGPAQFGLPLWSPDGQRVFFPSDRSGDFDLWSISVANGQPQGLPELVQKNTGFMDMPGITRDGSLFYGLNQNDVEVYTAEFDPESLRVGSPVLVTNRAVGNNRDPQLSPDGKSTAFVRRRTSAPAEVVVRSSITGDERVLTTLGSEDVYGQRPLEWFPDGQSLLVHDVNNRRSRFRRVDAQSGEAHPLLERPWNIYIGALSSDGMSLFYSNREDSTIRLVKRRLDTGEEVELYRGGTGGGFYGLTASPDGTRLAFMVNAPEARRVLMTIPTGGGQPRELLRTSHAELASQSAMTWTRDGRHLVFTGKCGAGEDSQLCAIPVEGGEAKSMGVSMQRIVSRMISADGRRIAFTNFTWKSELWVIRNFLSEPRSR